MNIKKLKEIITEELKSEISYRECSRGGGVYLAEKIDSYYITVSNIQTLQSIGKLVGVDKKLLDYSPWETEEDDNKFNYCGALDEIGVINNEKK